MPSQRSNSVRPIGTVWTQKLRACSGCGRKHQALCSMTDGTCLCATCQYALAKTGKDPS
jgi:hypothetical protein